MGRRASLPPLWLALLLRIASGSGTATGQKLRATTQAGNMEHMSKFEIFQGSTGKWRWRLIADNGKKVATSGETFDSRSNAFRAARNVKRLAPDATAASQPTSSVRVHVRAASASPSRVCFNTARTADGTSQPAGSCLDSSTELSRPLAKKKSAVNFRIPPGISLIRFKPHIPRHFRKRAGKRRAYMRTPPSCPATGVWTTAVVFSYRDGSTQGLAAATPCHR